MTRPPGSGWPSWAATSFVGAVWIAFWFWAFSFSFSDSFFQYHRHSRLPIFAAAMLAVGLILVSALLQWRSRRGVVAACLWHSAGVVLALGPFLIVAQVLMHAPDPWRPSADDAMGTGIDFLMICGAGIASVVLLALGLGLRAVLGRAEPGVRG